MKRKSTVLFIIFIGLGCILAIINYIFSNPKSENLLIKSCLFGFLASAACIYLPFLFKKKN
jgi:hypothetical protein